MQIEKPRNIVLMSIFLVFLGTIFVFRTGIFRASESEFLQILNSVFVGNDMIVEASPEIDIQKIKINKAFTEKTVFENSEFHNNIDKVYGGPKFDVYYDSFLIGRALHYNTNDWYVNEFVFYFYKDETNKPKFKFFTNGKSGVEEGYIWISNNYNTMLYESYDQNGHKIIKWSVENNEDLEKNLETCNSIWDSLEWKAKWFISMTTKTSNIDEIPNNIKSFYSNFISDSLSQKEKVDFDNFLGVISECDTTIRLNPKNWEYIFFDYTKFSNDQRLEMVYYFSDEKFYYEVYRVEIGTLYQFGFELKENKWKLTLYSLFVC